MERILVINPNSSQVVTDGIDRAMEPLRGTEDSAVKRMRDHDVVGDFDGVHAVPSALAPSAHEATTAG